MSTADRPCYRETADLKKTEKDCRLCKVSNLRDKSNDFSVVDMLSIVTTGGLEFGLVLLLIFGERCKHSKSLT